MGRPESPLPRHFDLGQLALATKLRSWRDQAGLTYRQLAAQTPYSQATLRRAASGSGAVPRLPVVEAYAIACGVPAKTARSLWRRARVLEVGFPYGYPVVPPPRLISDAAELRAGLRLMYYRAGRMPLEEMEHRAGIGRLPHTTLNRMLRGLTMLSPEQLVAFLEVCDVPEKDQEDWLEAMARVWKKQIILDGYDRRAYNRYTKRLNSGRQPTRWTRWPAPDQAQDQWAALPF